MIFTAIMFFSACEKDEYDQALSSEGKISSVENADHKVIAEYTYKNGLLVKSWNEFDYYSFGEKAEYEYKYNNKGMLIEQTGYQPGIMYLSSITGAMGKNVYISYEYDENDRIKKITTSNDYGKDNEEINYTVNQQFEYPDAKTVRSLVSSGNNFPVYHDYFFNDDGNIEKIEVYTFEDQIQVYYPTEEYTYDNKKAPYNVRPAPQSKNNVVKKIVTAYNYDEAGNRSVAYTSTYTYEYTYNSLGYPTSKTETYPNEIVIIEYYNY
jgi:hypothetical protein